VCLILLVSTEQNLYPYGHQPPLDLLEHPDPDDAPVVDQNRPMTVPSVLHLNEVSEPPRLVGTAEAVPTRSSATSVSRRSV
jgi:hypothetical protein